MVADAPVVAAVSAADNVPWPYTFVNGRENVVAPPHIEVGPVYIGYIRISTTTRYNSYLEDFHHCAMRLSLGIF